MRRRRWRKELRPLEGIFVSARFRMFDELVVNKEMGALFISHGVYADEFINNNVFISGESNIRST